MQIRRILSRSLASPSTASQSLASPSLAASRPGAGRLAAVLLGFCLILGAAAQSPAPEAVSEAAAAAPSVPQQVRFSGQLASRAGETVEAVFRVYAAAEGGEPLWSETQRVAVDGDGGYTVLLGSSSAQGLPQALFAGGQARWLGVSVEQAAELPRAQLASVPYAMKSADAATLAGHAAAEFVTQAQLGALAEAGSAQPAAATPQVIEATPTGSGATGAVPLWTSSTTLGNSEIVQVGSEIGINNAAPAATLDVSGSTALRGVVAIPPAGVATTTVGSNSHQLEMSASSWSTTAAAPVQQNFAWLAAATGNNTASPGGVLDLQFGSGTNPLLATGFSISSNGHVNFASGQTYPRRGHHHRRHPGEPHYRRRRQRAGQHRTQRHGAGAAAEHLLCALERRQRFCGHAVDHRRPERLAADHGRRRPALQRRGHRGAQDRGHHRGRGQLAAAGAASQRLLQHRRRRRAAELCLASGGLRQQHRLARRQPDPALRLGDERAGGHRALDRPQRRHHLQPQPELPNHGHRRRHHHRHHHLQPPDRQRRLRLGGAGAECRVTGDNLERCVSSVGGGKCLYKISCSALRSGAWQRRNRRFGHRRFSRLIGKFRHWLRCAGTKRL